MEDIFIVKNAIRKDKKKDRERKYEKCNYCNNYITKYNYSRHFYRKHYSNVKNGEKRIMIISNLFVKNTDFINDNLSQLNIILSEISKIQINSRKMKKQIWYKTYKKSIKQLTNLLKKNSNNNKEKEKNNDGEGEGEDNNNNDDDENMDID